MRARSPHATHAKVDLRVRFGLASAPLDLRHAGRRHGLFAIVRGRADERHADDVRELVLPAEVEDILGFADPQLDEGVVTTVKTWRFRPNLANNVPIPFCSTNMFEFKTQ